MRIQDRISRGFEFVSGLSKATGHSTYFVMRVDGRLHSCYFPSPLDPTQFNREISEVLVDEIENLKIVNPEELRVRGLAQVNWSRVGIGNWKENNSVVAFLAANAMEFDLGWREIDYGFKAVVNLFEEPRRLYKRVVFNSITKLFEVKISSDNTDFAPDHTRHLNTSYKCGPLGLGIRVDRPLHIAELAVKNLGSSYTMTKFGHGAILRKGDLTISLEQG